MKEPKYTIVTSDHHWGDGSVTDVFDVGTRRARYWNLLDYIEDVGARYVIAGDIGDCFVANTWAILSHYDREFRRLGDMKALFIPGNHDAQWAYVAFAHEPLLGSPPLSEQIFDVGPRSVLICHGHQADRYCNKPYPDLDAITALLAARRRRRRVGRRYDDRQYTDIAAGIVERLGSLWRRVLGKPSRLQETIDGMERLRVAESKDSRMKVAVVYGHTHVAGRVGDSHYNCGCLCGPEGEETFVRIDSKTGEIKTFRWTLECEAVEFDRELAKA